MPLIKKSNFQTSWLLRNPDFHTAFRSLFTPLEIDYKRKRITTPDQDFIDLDYSTQGSRDLVVIVHGLEGSSSSRYVLALTWLLNQNHYDTISMNLRGCSGEHNLLASSYHSGKTDDLDLVLNHIKKNHSYQNIHLVGYSLGGNQVLKYMGEYKNTMPTSIKTACAVSPPCDLKGCAIELSKKSRYPYMRLFLKSLKLKARAKSDILSESGLDLKALLNAKNFFDIDNLYTAPAHGFRDAEDYWKKSSSRPFLPSIAKPTLIISSRDDPFLSDSCLPFAEAMQSKQLYLEPTRFGGHVGFCESIRNTKIMWSEKRILDFIKNSR